MFRRVFRFFSAFLAVLLSTICMVLAVVLCVLYVPSARKAVLNKGVSIACEKTGLDIEIGDIYLSPFHHSPAVFYRAYLGKQDLPVEVRIGSLFVGHRGQDTLLYAHALRVKALARTSDSLASITDLNFPIEVEHVLVDQLTVHSDSLIEAVGIDGVLGLLHLSAPPFSIQDGRFPIRDLCLYDADVAIELRPTSDTLEVDTLPADTTPLRLAFDVPDVDIRRVHFRLDPMGIDVQTDRIATDASADVGANQYEARQLEIGKTVFRMGDLRIPVDTVNGKANVNLENGQIAANDFHVRSDEMEVQAELHTAQMNLNTMWTQTAGEVSYQQKRIRLKASYDIDDEAYDAALHIHRMDLASLVDNPSPIIVAGDIEASGSGIDPRKMNARVRVRLDEAQYDTYDLSHTTLEAATDSGVAVSLTMPSLDLAVRTPLSVFAWLDRLQPLLEAIGDSAVMTPLTSLEDLSQLDTIRPLIPPVQADIHIAKGSPVQAILDSLELGFEELNLAFHSDSDKTFFRLPKTVVQLPSSMRMPQAETSLDLTMVEGQTDLSLTAGAYMTDGVAVVNDLCTDAAFRMDLKRVGKQIHGTGRLTLDSLAYGSTDFGNRTANIALSPSEQYADAIRADVQLDDIPLDLLDEFVTLPDLDIQGAVRAAASVDGLPAKTDISAEVQPIGIAARYKPFEVGVSLGQTPIIMRHNHVDLNGLPVYMKDSTYLAFTGGLDIDSMRLDLRLDADSLVPVALTPGGPFPVYGDLAADLHGQVAGSLDSLVADVAVTLLPVTDITYPIDKKNLAQVKPHGTVTVHCPVTETDSMQLNGTIHVDEGKVLYSPKIYPIMPFRVDSGSNIAFNGPIGQTRLDVSASQKVKADVQSEGEETRRVDFTTGVRVHGELDSIGLNAIGFFLEAPDDETITRELASMEEETREGLAATLLATGMYVGESNAAAKKDGYALSSIINSRINAALANSKVGKVIDIDFSNAQTEHAGGTTNDMNISISKSFFKDRFRITIGSTLTDNPEVNKTSGLLSNLSAEYKMTQDGNVLLRAYADRDYNNVLEGELFKTGLGVRTLKNWRRKELYRTDSITRTYNLTADAGVVYRSNNSIGPDVTLKSSIRNLLGHGETFTLKGNGAYYWALRNRHPGDPRKTDTYKFGANASLIFPYLHWVGENNPEGDTRYMLGYQYENIAGGYGVHKLSGSFTYFIHSSRYVTHAFTPLSLSVVLMKAESDSLLDKSEAYPELIKVIAGDEFVPSIGYTFTYNDYRAKRPVNTLFEVGVKESGNIINALYCAFGHKWDEKNKQLGAITFHQFVKMNLELRNKFNFTDQVCIATRLFAGANIPLGNSYSPPLSEAFYAGGPNSMRATSPYAYGPGNFYSEKYNQNFFHAGDVKLEANFELRFPIVWKLFGAAFLDAGNIWNWYNSADLFNAAGITDYKEQLQLRGELYDGIINNPDFANQIALGTGAGLRLDLDGLVIRLDIGVAIHSPYQTYRYDKKTWQPDKTQPINSYFNIPSAVDAIRVNFGIGYPF